MFKALANWTWDGLGPGMFSIFHIVWLVITVILSVVFVLFGKKKHSEKRDDTVILCFGLLLLVLEIVKELMYDVGYYGYVRIDILPFSFCSMPVYVALVGSLVKNAKVKETCYKFLAFFGLLGGIFTMIYPASLETFFIFTSFHTMIWHISMVLMGVYLIAARGYGKNLKNDLLSPSILFVCLSLVAVALNEAVYFGVLKPAQETPPTYTYEAEYMPGSYTSYKFGINGENGYSFLGEADGQFVLTPVHKDSLTVVITFADENGEQLLLQYTDENDSEKYIEIVDRQLVTTSEPTKYWEFSYIGTHPAFVTADGDTLLCIDFTDGKVGVGEYTAAETAREGSFILFTLEGIDRSGDSVNFFFISNHSETPIPVLSSIQKVAPYPVFILCYVVGFIAVTSLLWLIVHFSGKLKKEK